ncbi:MAG: DUF1801 domain-containing protein [Pseudomonadota bacterium]
MAIIWRLWYSRGMSEMKTVETDQSVTAYLAGVEPPGRRADAETVIGWMTEISGMTPRLWGDSLIGFGAYSYTRADGSRHRFFRTGLAARKSALSIHVLPALAPHRALLEALGPHRATVSCLYVTRLARVDGAVLRKIIAAGWAEMAERYPDDTVGGR